VTSGSLRHTERRKDVSAADGRKSDPQNKKAALWISLQEEREARGGVFLPCYQFYTIMLPYVQAVC
jgi:hypothetical protein